MTNKIHMMIDIETLDTAPSAVVLELSTVIFTDSHGIKQTSPATYIFDRNHQVSVGRTASQDTLDWWDEKLSDKSYKPQDKIYLEQLLNNKSVNITPLEAHAALTESLKQVTGYIWCKGASFDFPIIKSFFKSFNLSDPFSDNKNYRKQMDLRTYETIARDVGFTEYTTHTKIAHISFDDCLDQIGMYFELRDYILSHKKGTPI